jgi:hypothetical protein
MWVLCRGRSVQMRLDKRPNLTDRAFGFGHQVAASLENVPHTIPDGQRDLDTGGLSALGQSVESLSMTS